MAVLNHLKEYITEECSSLFSGGNCNWISNYHLRRRSRRKGVIGDDKENGVVSNRPAGSVTAEYDKGLRNSQSSDFSLCDMISTDQFLRLVILPPGMHLNEWLATHTVSFFHHINALYGAISEFCTSDTCPVMLGPGSVPLPWVDEKGKKWKYAAPQYIDSCMSFIQRTVSSEDGVPSKHGSAFPVGFDVLVRRVFRHLWHVHHHIHSEAHWRQLTASGLDSQSAAVTAHLSAFVDRFALLDAKDALALAALSRAICRPHLVMAPSSLVPRSATADAMDTSEQLGGAAQSCAVGGGGKSGSWGGSKTAADDAAQSSVKPFRPCAITC